MEATKQDIKNEEDIKLLVDTFYDKVNQNILLSPIFNDFAHVNWESHLPTMYRFWNGILFGEGGYKGSPFEKHIPLPIDKTHFENWLILFKETVDALFEGNKADEAKQRATIIAYTFQSKLEYMNNKKK
ncbi:truncated hemoglobin [Bernardetia litoralis DSM 6794]|uniref:Truncated hemoglobin n=1 Tax=Bernardetia litoralis (strain ATCC 23117 / DSM 6794 / NBRC 15988 / NCIMB 1366 / Fx l1 / Sio-4) TaxID=880071 RepID=I4AGK4_BERLS|nr:group III truncated hemoglobin [Bernardetia litoralis]AFM03089.1 truncated hemoglobin [Bernardetia litoralis DSM 6794]